ncbi:MAG: ABC transporter permease [Steroidobacteraceae bacterium]
MTLIRRQEAEGSYRLCGEWTLAKSRQITAELDALGGASAQHLSFDTGELVALDVSAAWLLQRFVLAVEARGGAVRFLPQEPEPLRLVRTSAASESGRAAAAAGETRPALERLGLAAVRRWRDSIAGLAFIGLLASRAGSILRRPRRSRPVSIARHIYDTGITAIPIVALIAFLISVIVAYMGAQQLRKFGADIFVVDLVTVGVLREMGVLLTAIIVAGRSGSSFAAELGAMQLNEEVDALDATGVDPAEVLIMPRIVGLVIALPLLTIIADCVGLAGGAILCRALLDMPFVQYASRMIEAIAPTTFWVGMIKAPVFAMLIAASGTFRGLQVRGSSRELGRLTTVAVVQSIFLVILADALFAVLFMELDI